MDELREKIAEIMELPADEYDLEQCKGMLIEAFQDYLKKKIEGLDIEQIFADVAGLAKKQHKNVLGDKWKYINAVKDELLRMME